MTVYKQLIEHVFFSHYQAGDTCVLFSRNELSSAAVHLGLSAPSNLGDVVYSFRYRTECPESIAKTAPDGQQWVIRPKGRGKYAFELADQARIIPQDNLVVIKIPDATPEIIVGATRSDEQAVLAKVRYNRLIDIFLGLTAYSLQSHLRTTVPDMGQVEVDEVYVAVDQHGRQYVIPVEAKGYNDELGIVQTEQDLGVCQSKWEGYDTIAVGVQSLRDDVIALFELVMQDGAVKVAKERHYQLVPSSSIGPEDRALYRRLSQEVAGGAL